jgi:hypothetical protein
MANTSIVDLNADFVGPRRFDLDFLNGQVLACFPGDRGLAWIQNGIDSSVL